MPHQSMNRSLLVGPPNAGKTTLFNWLTGFRAKTVNYPGSTVVHRTGALLSRYGANWEVTDTPGISGLTNLSDDENVTVELLKRGDFDSVIFVLDATQLARQMAMLKVLEGKEVDIVVAITMTDLVSDKKGLNQFLRENVSSPYFLIDGRLGLGISELAQQLNQHTSVKRRAIELSKEDMSQFVHESKKIAHELSKQNKPSKRTTTAALDRYLLHPFWGLLFFLTVTTLLFTSVFWLAAPMMDFVDGFFSSLASLTSEFFDGSLLGQFLADGGIAGFGAFLVFVPQIAILFLILNFLEDSGYLARAAALIDRPLSAIGLSGRSFVPIVSGFACAVPAVMATRQIRSRRERLLTILILPLMTCSARLPVYALLLSFLFWGQPAWIPGLALAFLYIFGLILGAVVASIVKPFMEFKQDSFLILELPYYRRPRWKVMLKNVIDQTGMYVRNAGPIILLISIALWAGSTFPDYNNPDSRERMESSYLGQTGQALDVVMKPLDLDWRAGVALIASFAAREVFVSAMAIMYAVEGEDEEQVETGLLSKMQMAKNKEGEPLFSFAAVAALLGFFAIALQCMSTFAITRQETKSWKFALGQLIGFNVLAYLFAVLIVVML